MQLTRIRCTNCGAEFEDVSEDQQLFRCTRKGCGAVFLVDQGRRFSDIEQLKADQIQRLRAGLRASLSPFDPQQADLYAREILSMIPEDFRARATLCLCQAINGRPLALRRLLEGELTCPEEEFLEMYPVILARCEYRELMALEGAAEMVVNAHGLEDCLSAVERRKEELRRKSDCYADIPRDVFICFSSVDSAKARRVVSALEEDGNQCWISSRNLIPDAPDYWARIEQAIRRCRVFLVLCSEASMLSKDVQRELTLAEQIGNARLEIKLDETPHTTQFRFFFDGISWIDATCGMEGALAQVKRRVYEVLHPIYKAQMSSGTLDEGVPRQTSVAHESASEHVEDQVEVHSESSRTKARDAQLRTNGESVQEEAQGAQADAGRQGAVPSQAQTHSESAQEAAQADGSRQTTEEDGQSQPQTPGESTQTQGTQSQGDSGGSWQGWTTTPKRAWPKPGMKVDGNAQSAVKRPAGRAKADADSWKRQKLKGKDKWILAGLLFINFAWTVNFREALFFFIVSGVGRSQVLNAIAQWLNILPALSLIIVSVDVWMLVSHGRSKAAVYSTLAIWFSSLIVKFMVQGNVSIEWPGWTIGLLIMLACIFAPCLYMLRHARQIGGEE